MKTLHLHLFKMAFGMMLFFAVQSCVVKPGTWKNERIDPGKREDFHKLNTDVLWLLKANDPKGLRFLFSKEMNARHNDRDIELISNRLTDNDYVLLDEYNVIHKFKDVDTVPIKSGDINRYSLEYPYEATEMYMAYFVPKKGINKYMISLVYGKLNYGWKIVKLKLAPYTINGKTAPELFALAEDEYDKKQIQAALNTVELAVTCFEPGAYWKYPDEGEAGAFYTRVHQEVNLKYNYPLVLRQIATGPMLLRVYNKNTDNGNGTYPLVYYMTHFELKDTTEVKKENLEIRKVISKLMPGLGRNNQYIFYSAFNKQPTGYTSVDHFDMMEKLP